MSDLARTGPIAPLVELAGLRRTFASVPPVEALRPCDLRIDDGDYVAIVGPSGSGKSTLLNLIGLLDAPTGGVYRFRGRDVAAVAERERTALRASSFGFVFQDFSLLPRRTVAENVELGLRYAGAARGQRAESVRGALESVGMLHRHDAFPTTLSGGEQQRTAIARALVRQPELLLCDEPTGNLDSRRSKDVLDLLDALHDDGRTLVVVTHDRDVARRADRVVTVADGVVEERHR